MSTVIRYQPWNDVVRRNLAMAERMRNLAEQSDQDGGTRSYRLPVDVYGTDDAFIITAAVPGLNPEDITINFEDDVLSISGEFKNGTMNEDAKVIMRERLAEGHFERRLRLNVPVQTDQIEATYHDGILTLNVPKAPEARPLNIPVKVAHN
ncbi:MAG: Hsp20/alpha crystallin family protein [Anaerolineae bacterium]|nr:Hsp20/alpha crystallin family protein [Anaerolineae bacterium]